MGMGHHWLAKGWRDKKFHRAAVIVIVQIVQEFRK